MNFKNYALAILATLFSLSSLLAAGFEELNGELYTNKNVGIGLQDPQQPLHILGKARLEDGGLQLHYNLNNDPYQAISYSFQNQLKYVIDYGTGSSLDLRIAKVDGNAVSMYMNFDYETGFVGVGKSNPDVMLDVVGAIKSTSTIKGVGSITVESTSGAGSILNSTSTDPYNYLSFRTQGVSQWVVDHGGQDTNDFSIRRMAGGHTPMMTFSGASDKVYFHPGIQLGIGTSEVGDYQLSVKGKIRAHEIKVYTNWADYVFKPDYKLMPLNEVAQFIKENNHLPGVPKGEKVETEGLNLGEMQAKQMEKIEELTLYIIAQNKQMEKLMERLEQLEGQNVILKNDQ